MKLDGRRIVVPPPGTRFFAVTLKQKVGLLTIKAKIRHVNAKDKEEAGLKALMFHLRRNPGTEPTIVSIELEHYDRAIQL